MNFSNRPLSRKETVKITRTCPYYGTFTEKVGWVRKVSKDPVGYLYLVEIKGGDKVYLRRSEFTVLSDRKAG